MGGNFSSVNSMAATSLASQKVDDLSTLSSAQLKSFLKSQRVDTSGCLERKDLVSKLEKVKGKALHLGAVRNDLNQIMHDRNWDDGSYAPLLIRM